MISDASLLPRRRLERRIGCEPGHEVAPEVHAEIGETFVAQRLDSAHNRGRVNIVSFGQLARGKKGGLFAVPENGADQLLAMRPQPGLRFSEARLQRRGQSLRAIPAGIRLRLLARSRVTHARPSAQFSRSIRSTASVQFSI